MTVEQALRYLEDRAVLMRFLVEGAAESAAAMEPKVLLGLGDIFEDMETMARRAREALTVGALGADLR